MSRQPRPTLADYLVIAVTPALVMAMVGSFVFFLLDIFYRGEYSGKLHYIMALFVFAAVLIARIAVELGKDRAMMYALPLALATMLVLGRFVVDSSFLLNIALIALIWWGAHKLTIDCTFIDESQDSSGEGLLRTAGLEGRGGDKTPTTVASNAELDEAADRVVKRGSWLRRRADRPTKPHTPGTWIVYVALTTLPIFGFGHRFVPTVDRRYAFGLFFVYVAAGLGLLLTTSFLGLRRYLRQRRLEMPSAMAATWMTLGVALGVGLLVLTALLPRPGAEYAASEPPFRFVSPPQESSRLGAGSEGADKNPNDAPAATDAKPRDVPDEDRAASGDAPDGPKRSSGGKDSPPSDSAGKGKGKDQDQGQGQGKGKGKGQGSKDKTASSSKPRAGDDAPSKSKRPSSQETHEGNAAKEKTEPTDSAQTESEKDSSQDKNDKNAENDSSENRADEDREAKKRTGEDRADENRPGKKQAERKSSGGSPSGAPRKSWSPPKVEFNFGLVAMATLLKWALYAVLIVAVIVGLLRHRSELLDALRRFIASWRDFWAGLFGGRAKPQPAGTSPVQTPVVKDVSRRFADYVDPFAAGIAARYSPDELIRYTFEALQAYGRDVGRPRRLDETAHEFARAISDRAVGADREIRVLAELYSRMAYAPGTLSEANVRPLAQFWQAMAAGPRPAQTSC